MTVEAGPEVLDIALGVERMARSRRTGLDKTVIVNMTFTAGQLLWVIIHWPRIGVAMSTVACLGFCCCMVVVLAVAVVTGDEGAGLTAGNRIHHIGISAVMTGRTGKPTVVNMLDHHVGIVTVGTAG